MNRLVGSLLAITAMASTLGVSQVNAAVYPHFSVSTLVLPNGKVLTNHNVEGVRWKDIYVSLGMPAVPSQYPYGQSLVGNHSQILSHKFISTPYGRAWFGLNERTPPAASLSTKPTYEYWVAIECTSASTGYNIDYAIEATVIGNRTRAQREVKQLISGWMVPSSADPVPVSISRRAENLKLAQAVQTYLENMSDSSIISKFTILKITRDAEKFGKQRWTVKFNAEHWPSKTDAYNNGINYRYIIYKPYNNGYIVTGLATG